MSQVNQSFRSYVVALFIILMLSVFASYHVEIEIEPIENTQAHGTDGNGSSSDADFSKPWESPMEELQRIAQRCDEEVPDFIQIAHQATQASCKTCMDSIKPNFSTSETTSKITSLIICEMQICFSRTAFKFCWLSIIAALNECEEGIGDVVGAIYFALYDDMCRDGGRLTIKNQRKVAEEGEPCFRNYSTPECEKNKLLRNSNDVCLRFNSITACDLSSIDPDCSNEEYKADTPRKYFKRVGQQLQCDSKNSKPNADAGGELKTVLVATKSRFR